MPIARVCLRAYGYATDFRYGSITAVACFSYRIFAPCYLHCVHRHSQNFRCWGYTQPWCHIEVWRIKWGEVWEKPLSTKFAWKWHFLVLCNSRILSQQSEKIACCSSLRWLPQPPASPLATLMSVQSIVIFAGGGALIGIVRAGSENKKKCQYGSLSFSLLLCCIIFWWPF